MKKTVQKIRVAAMIIGCCVIILGIIFHLSSFISDMYQMRHSLRPVSYMLPIGLLYSTASSLSIGTLIILLALLINPEKVVPLFDKRESHDEDTESE